MKRVIMKQHESGTKQAYRRKGSVAKTILVSYLIVLLLPLFLTVVIIFATVTKLQAQSEQYITINAAELSRLLGAHIEEIMSNNSRILLTDEAKQLAAVDSGDFTMADIGKVRTLQKQLPRDTVTSEYMQAIYVCFPRSGTILTAGSVYYDYNANYMLRDYLGMSLATWKAFLESAGSEQVSLVTGDMDHRGHLLVAKRLSSKGGLSDVVVVSEFRNEKAVLLMDEFSEKGGLIHSLTDGNGTVLSSSYAPEDHISYDELLSPVEYGTAQSGITLRTQTPRNRFLRQTMPLFRGLAIYFLFFAVAGVLMIRYFTKRQYTPIEQLNASLLRSLNRSEDAEHGRKKNEFDQMSEAVAALLQTNASSREENALLRENIRRQLLQGILFGNIRKEDMILRHAENNGIRFVGSRFLAVLYAVEDLQQSEQSGMLMQSEETMFRLDEIIRTAIGRLPDNGTTRYAVEVEEQVACIVSLPDDVSEEQAWKDVLANIQQVREFFRGTFGVILTAAVSRLHSGVVSITTCFRECREAADYMELIGTNIPVCRYDQIPAAADEALSFPEVLEKEKKLCRTLSTGDYRSAESAWQEVREALSLRNCSQTEARARLLGAASLMVSSLSDLPPELEEIHSALHPDSLQRIPDLDGMLRQIQEALAALAAHAAAEKNLPHTTETQFITYVNEHITDPNLSISVIADHFNMSTSYFSKRFKKAAGENLLDYIHRERLTLAKQILDDHPETTLKEICDRVGYASPLTLNRAFRKYEGITPSDYRAQR